MLLEIVSLRGGFYQEKVYDYGSPLWNNNTIGGLTYGIGLQMPVYKLTQLPLKINLDYTSLPQTSHSKVYTNWDNFTNYTLRLNWILKK